MAEIPPEARLAYFNKQRPGILLCYTLKYNEIPHTGQWICDLCLIRHIDKSYGCKEGYRHSAIGNTYFATAICAICQEHMDIYIISDACKDCSYFFQEYFTNISNTEFIRHYYGHGIIAKRWLDYKVFRVSNPCDTLPIV